MNGLCPPPAAVDQFSSEGLFERDFSVQKGPAEPLGVITENARFGEVRRRSGVGIGSGGAHGIGQLRDGIRFR